MLDSCSPTGTRSFMPGNEFDVPQNGCNKETFVVDHHPQNFPSCRISHSIWDSIWAIRMPKR